MESGPKVILEILGQHPQGVSEYDLIVKLRALDRSPLPEGSLHDQQLLYRTHFLLFHALYRLRDHLLKEERALLEIAPLCIRLLPFERNPQGLCQSDPLRDYYLDLANLELSADEVDDLLTSFWRLFLAGEERQDALAEMDLEDPVTLPEVRTRYRELAKARHPDRGGSKESIQRLNAAMAVLNVCIAHP